MGYLSLFDRTFPFQNGLQLANYVWEHGNKRLSRLGPMREMLNPSFFFDSRQMVYRPGMAPTLGVVELLQVISGYFDERMITKVAPKLIYPYGLTHAYGIKIAQQLEKVIKQLNNWPETRRALVHIGKPEDGQEEDKPCMQSIQFQIRSHQLYTTVYARSWDLVSGLPYDVMVMNGLAQMVGHLTDSEPMFTTFMVGSAHVYEEIVEPMLWKYSDKMDYSKFATLKFDPAFMPRDYSKESVDKLQTFSGWREWAIDSLNDIDNWKRFAPEGIVIR